VTKSTGFLQKSQITPEKINQIGRLNESSFKSQEPRVKNGIHNARLLFFLESGFWALDSLKDNYG
jgi:hypothetical protein